MIIQISKKPIHWLESGVFRYLLTPPPAWRQRSNAEGLKPAERFIVLNEIAKIYKEQLKASSIPLNKFFVIPGSPPLVQTRQRSSSRYEHITDLEWESDYEPFWQDSPDFGSVLLQAHGIDRQQSFSEKWADAKTWNHRCRVRVIHQGQLGERPILICLHGYGGGYFSVEQKLWPVKATLRLGIDIVFFVLPQHAYRREPKYRALPPRFPSRDPRFTVEGFRQISYDLHTLRGYLQQIGTPWVALSGMSLGGYSASLMATIDPSYKFILPVIPLGSMTATIDRQSRFTGTDEQKAEQIQLLQDIYSLVDPLSRQPLYNADRMAIIAGQGDGITGIGQAELLAQHFSCPIHTFPGGHLIRPGFQRCWIDTLQNLKAC